jgi:proteasome accessory factor A
MADCLLGVETEYAISGMAEQETHDRHSIVRHLLSVAHSTLPHVSDLSSSGMFLENAARLYLDCGLHMEYSTPECANPWDAVRYVEAGHQTMLKLIQRLTSDYAPEVETGCYRINVDYSGTGSTWGCHESYLHRADPNLLPPHLIPHLVTRIVYTGAGGFEPFSRGLRFTLSPRAAHIERTISSDSTSDRGIFHTKDEPLCAGHHRLHVLCGESLCSHTAMFVKFGATSLIVAMTEAGLCPGDGVQLASPLAALRTVAGDPACSKPLKVKGPARMTAIEIQRHYLAMAEAHVKDAFMPPWASVVCEQWRRVLDLLDAGAAASAKVLDWPAKLALFASHAVHRGLDWEHLQFWNDTVDRMSEAMALPQAGGVFPFEQMIGIETPIPAVIYGIEALMRKKGYVWDELREILALRAEFLEIDMRFGQLGKQGLFTALDEAGVLDHRVSGIDNIQHAIQNPPNFGRAKLRGAVVKRVAGDKEGDWYGDWQRIFSPRYRRSLDLSDPFAKTEEWHDDPPSERAMSL